MEVCAKWKVPIVITSLGARVELNEAVHGWGGITLHDIIDDRFARKAVEKGADGIIAVAVGRGRPCRALVAVRAAPGNPPVVRRPADPLGRDRQRRRGARGAGGGRGPRLRRLAVHRDRRGQCARRLQAGDRRRRRGRHRLHRPLHRRARQLSALVDRRRRARPGRPRGRQSRHDEVRLGGLEQVEGLARHLGIGPGHRRHRPRPARGAARSICSRINMPRPGPASARARLFALGEAPLEPAHQRARRALRRFGLETALRRSA